MTMAYIPTQSNISQDTLSSNFSNIIQSYSVIHLHLHPIELIYIYLAHILRNTKHAIHTIASNRSYYFPTWINLKEKYRNS